MILPDPDDPRFGHWADQWVVALRAAGAEVVAAFRAWCYDYATDA